MQPFLFSRSLKMSHHLTPFEYGQIKAHLQHDQTAAEITRLVRRANGQPFSTTAIHAAIQKLTDDPSFRGERAEGSGAPRKTSKALDNRIIKLCLSKN